MPVIAALAATKNTQGAPPLLCLLKTFVDLIHRRRHVGTVILLPGSGRHHRNKGKTTHPCLAAQTHKIITSHRQKAAHRLRQRIQQSQAKRRIASCRTVEPGNLCFIWLIHLKAMHQSLKNFLADRDLACILDIGQRFKNCLPVETRQLVQNKRSDIAGNGPCGCLAHLGLSCDLINAK